VKKSDLLKQFAKKERPSSAGSQANDPAKIKEMLKYLKNKSGTSEKKLADPPTTQQVKNELQIKLDDQFEKSLEIGVDA